MERTLEAALRGREPRRIRDFREIPIIPEAYRDEKIFRLVDRFAERYGELLVLYGGLASTERVYGAKRIREITTDLDFACGEAGLDAVLAGERVAYHELYDILYEVSDNVPVSFAYGHIHDWPLDGRFFAEAVEARPGSRPIRCCSPERCAMLKLRRVSERLDRGLHPFGKDALDLLNMLAAPAGRAAGPSIDPEKLRGLVRDGVAPGEARALELLAFLRGYEAHLSAPEREAAEARLEAAWRGLAA